MFDWNRVTLDDQPRPLHIEESLRSINFNDVCPTLQSDPGPEGGLLVACPYFRVERWLLSARRSRLALEHAGGRCAIFTVLSGRAECAEAIFAPGDFFLVPASLLNALVTAVEDTTLLRTTLP